MIRFTDMRRSAKLSLQEGFETAEMVMKVTRTPKEGIYAYEELQELVRCHRCKHYMLGRCERLFDDEYLTFEVNPDGFCDWGERIDDD